MTDSKEHNQDIMKVLEGLDDKNLIDVLGALSSGRDDLKDLLRKFSNASYEMERFYKDSREIKNDLVCYAGRNLEVKQIMGAMAECAEKKRDELRSLMEQIDQQINPEEES